jgi:CRISPR/Cas system-associated endonuclease Cas1
VENGRVSFNKDDVEQGLVKLVLTVVELLRQLVERQAIKRVEGGTLTEEQIENLGATLFKLEEKMNELIQIFGLEKEELNLDLGPLGQLM